MVRRWHKFIWGLLAFVVSACGVGIPDVTPTLAPTDTPQPTDIVLQATDTPVIELSATPTVTPSVTASVTTTATAIPSATPTGTQTPSATPTVTPSVTASATASATRTPSATPTGTQTPSATPTLTPSVTASATATVTHTPSATVTATVTPLIISASDTPTRTITPSQTATPRPSLTPSPLPATATSTPDRVATQNAQLLQTRAARPTFTPVPQASPTDTVIPPTLDVTPTFVTAVPEQPQSATLPPIATVVLSTPTFAPDAPTATVIAPTPTPFPPDQIPATIVPSARTPVNESVGFTFTNTNVGAYTFDLGGVGQIIFNGQSLGGNISLFAVNPVDPSSYVSTNTLGLPVFRPIGGGETIIVSNPYFNGFYGAIGAPDENKNFITDVAWSPDGRNFTFIIQPPGGTDTGNAGTWYWSQAAGRAFPVMRDCPAPGFASCNIIANRPAANWQSRNVEWSPDSTRALITVWLSEENRQAVTVTTPRPTENVTTAPDFLRFENAHWYDDERLIVSGLLPDRSRSIVGLYNLTRNQYERTLFEPSSAGLYIQDAVRLPDNRIVALGRDINRPDSASRLYRISNGQATPISATVIGTGAPQRIEWAQDYSTVVLTIDGVQYSVDTRTGASRALLLNGDIRIGGDDDPAPVGQRGVPNTGGDDLPSGVIAGSRYSAGQQIQFIGTTPRNVRQAPDYTVNNVVDRLNPDEYVTILAGPYTSDNLEWWFVSTARNVQGWTSTQTADGQSRFFAP